MSTWARFKIVDLTSRKTPATAKFGILMEELAVARWTSSSASLDDSRGIKIGSFWGNDARTFAAMRMESLAPLRQAYCPHRHIKAQLPHLKCGNTNNSLAKATLSNPCYGPKMRSLTLHLWEGDQPSSRNSGKEINLHPEDIGRQCECQDAPMLPAWHSHLMKNQLWDCHRPAQDHLRVQNQKSQKKRLQFQGKDILKVAEEPRREQI